MPTYNRIEDDGSLGRRELRARAAGNDSGREGRHVARGISRGERTDGAGRDAHVAHARRRRTGRRTWTTGFWIPPRRPRASGASASAAPAAASNAGDASVSAHDNTVPTREEIVRATERPLPRCALRRVRSRSQRSARSCSSSARSRIGARSRLAGVPRQLAVLRHDLAGRRHVRRGAAHHDRALVAPDRPLPRGLRRLPAGRVPAADRRSSSARSTSSRGRCTAMVEPEKRLYLNPPFSFRATCCSSAVSRAMSIWYIYRSVRLDVGLLPESGAAWARGLRARMRSGFRDERREIHSTHSHAGQARRLDVPRLRLLLVGAGAGISRCRSTCTSRARCTAGGSSWAPGSARS